MGLKKRTAVRLGIVLVVLVFVSYLYSCRRSRDVAGALNGLRWELRCEPGGSPRIACGTTPKAIVAATLRGSQDQHYLVELRFRGVVEEKSYTGGSNDGAHWQIGGAPERDPYNVYSLRISDPPQMFYLNRGRSFRSECLQIDYTKSIEMRGGTSVELIAESIDNQEIVNRDSDGRAIVVSGVPPDPKVFDGQFIQMDVLSVRPTP
jgi:hypothetical protein